MRRPGMSPILALAACSILSCAARTPAGSGSTEAASTDGSASSSTASTTSSPTSDTSDGGTSAGDTAATWPECIPPSIPDVAVAMTVEPDNGYTARAYSGPCSIAQVSDVVDGAATIELACTGGEGPAPQWQVGITIAGLGDAVPAALVENAEVDLALYVDRGHAPVTAFSLAIGGALQLGGLDGTYVDVDYATGTPKGLWPGARVTSATEQRCPQEQLGACDVPLGRNVLSFTGFDDDVLVFDHQSKETTSFEMRVGDALTVVDDAQPWSCEDNGVELFQFLVLRKS